MTLVDQEQRAFGEGYASGRLQGLREAILECEMFPSWRAGDIIPALRALMRLPATPEQLAQEADVEEARDRARQRVTPGDDGWRCEGRDEGQDDEEAAQ